MLNTSRLKTQTHKEPPPFSPHAFQCPFLSADTWQSCGDSPLRERNDGSIRGAVAEAHNTTDFLTYSFLTA